MRRVITGTLCALLLGSVALTGTGAVAAGPLEVGFGVRRITPVGDPPAAWGFWVNPETGIWSEEFVDSTDGGPNDNGYWDPGEPFVDDLANSLIDPQSTGEFDGCWTNAGFSGRGPLGVYDDTWARAIVLRSGDSTVAMVSLDVVGFFYEEIERARIELDARYPGHGIDKLIVSSTHTHEACDTMGLWGNPGYATDGKFPLYQAFIRSQIVDAVAEATDALGPARMKAATTVHTAGIRDSRPPDHIDPYLQAAQFVRPDDDSVIGTIVNWSNHPEALASGNRYISSDFPHGTRTKLETTFGGTAVYFSGSVGGLMTPLRVDMGPPYGDAATKERAWYIGELVADAAIDALAAAPLETVTSLDVVSKEVFMPGDNYSLRVLNAIGIFDKPTYAAGLPAGPFGDEFKTELVSVKVGTVRFQTVPGELFPELEIGGYGRPDCPEADTGRPYEPVIAEQYAETHLFTLGLAQDELGYIVPGYDFWIFGAPQDAGEPQAFVNVGVNEADDPCGEGHYEETVSASSVLAPLVACTAAELAGNDPWNRAGTDPAYAACSEENTTVGPLGTHPGVLMP